MFESGNGTAGARALKDRLRAALQQPAREPAANDASVTALPDLSGLGGRWFDSPQGPGYVIESVYEPGHEHGRVALHRALTVSPAQLAGQIRDDRLAACHPRDFLYVDTETTGLGGAGVMVFLAGVARFDDSVLRLRQYLLPAPSHEGGLLGGLSNELASAGALVSYNGKSFDLPVLETRYILSRQEPEWRSLPHLDLLHPNRRLFRGFDSHRLVHMEQEVLGFEREHDCPSAEVPQRYFEFQRSGDPTWIAPVLRHNAWDILSLVALAATLGEVCEGGSYPLQAARAAEYRRDLEPALGYYARALEGSLPRAERLEALERLASCCRRLGRFAESASHWEAYLAEPRNRRLAPYVELAKLHEHRLKSPDRALALVKHAIGLVTRGEARPGPAGSETSLAALRHRRDRLLTRLGAG